MEAMDETTTSLSQDRKPEDLEPYQVNSENEPNCLQVRYNVRILLLR
jgi:hypothetical protein